MSVGSILSVDLVSWQCLRQCREQGLHELLALFSARCWSHHEVHHVSQRPCIHSHPTQLHHNGFGSCCCVSTSLSLLRLDLCCQNSACTHSPSSSTAERLCSRNNTSGKHLLITHLSLHCLRRVPRCRTGRREVQKVALHSSSVTLHQAHLRQSHGRSWDAVTVGRPDQYPTAPAAFHRAGCRQAPWCT